MADHTAPDINEKLGEEEVDLPPVTRSLTQGTQELLDQCHLNLESEAYYHYQYHLEGKKQGEVYYFTQVGIVHNTPQQRKYFDDVEQCTKTVYYIHEHWVWAWKEFLVTEVIENRIGDLVDSKYSGRFNGQLFQELTFPQLKDLIVPTACIWSECKALFGYLFLQYLEGEADHIPRFATRSVCGFDRDGWVLPDKFRISMNQGIQSRYLAQIDKMTRLTLPEASLIHKMVHDLYAVYTLDHKDILFAYACIQPFLYALKSKIKLQPALALGSAMGETGKTSGMGALTVHWWNNTNGGSGVLTKDNLDSKSRALEYFSTSTFALILDDIGQLESHLQSEIKTFQTEESNYERKKPDGNLLISKPFTTPLIYTWNILPLMFNLLEVLQRTLFIPITHSPTHEEAERFRKVLLQIPSGVIGRYIYTTTADWTGEMIYQRFDGMKANPEIPGVRHQDFDRLLRLGAIFAKEWFNLDLDLSALPNLFKATMDIGNEELFSIITTQILKGCTDEGRRAEKWIQSPIIPHEYLKQEGWVFNASNKTDLMSRLKTHDTLSLEYLANILKSRWPHTVHNTIKVDGNNAKRVFIAKCDLVQGEPTDPLGCYKDQIWDILMQNDHHGSLLDLQYWLPVMEHTILNASLKAMVNAKELIETDTEYCIPSYKTARSL